MTIHILLNDKIEEMSETLVMQLIDTLPDWRREKALRFKHLAGKRECAVAYQLLQEGLREHYGIEDAPHFVIGEHEKPSLQEHPAIHFNLSHCHTAVLCALCNQPVGVDIERRRECKEALVRHTMNEAEQLLIRTSQDPAMTFTELWTAKEAVVKLTGEGLACNIPDILIDARNKGIHIDTHTNRDKGYAYSIATYSSVIED